MFSIMKNDKSVVNITVVGYMGGSFAVRNNIDQGRI